MVANLVWRAVEGTSQAEIARVAGLSRSTVSAIVGELIAAGLIVADRLAPKKAGRPAVVLCFNARRAHIIGVEIGSSHITVALCDLRGRVQWSAARDHDVPHDPRGTIELIGHLIDTARARPEALGDLLGIGVAVPCPVDTVTLDRLSPRLLPAWSGVRLAALLHGRFGARLFVDNDGHCGALGEAWHGAGRDVNDFTYIKVATGVGGGLILDGVPYHGSSGIAGELGHTSVDPHGRRCRCGLRGCLEAEIGSPAIIDKAHEALASGRASVLADRTPVRLSDVVDCANAGDALSRELVAEAGRYLGTAVANLLNLFNPARVVIGGRLVEAGDHFMSPLRCTVRDRALWASIERADVVVAALGDEHVAVGAATLVLRAALEDLSLFPAAAVGRDLPAGQRLAPGAR